MKKGFVIFLISIVFAGFSFSAEEPAQQKLSIQEIKGKLAIKDVKTRNETFLLIKEYGIDKFVQSYESEEDQLKLCEYALWGGSSTEASFIRADILSLLLDSKSDKVKIEASKGLLRFAMYADQPRAVKGLIAMMDLKNQDARLTALKTIDKMMKEPAKAPRPAIKIPEIEESMLKYYQDENKDVLIAVIKLFSKSKNPKVVEKVKSLINHKEPEVRRLAFAFYAENEIKDEDVHKAAIKTVQEVTDQMLPQRAAARYLGFLKDEKAVPLIVKMLKNFEGREKSQKNENISVLKVTAIRALAKIGNDEALKYLVEAVQADDTLSVIAEAGIAIQSITKKDFGYTADLVESQKIIAGKKFKIWYIESYLKEGEKRKDELAKLKEEVERLIKELSTKIIMEKLELGSLETKQKAILSIYDVGIKKFVSDVMKQENRLVIVESIAYTYGDEQFMRKNMEVLEAFLFEKDESILPSVILSLGRSSNYVNYDTVIPRLEELLKSDNMLVASAVNQALPAVKASKTYNIKQKTIEKDKPK